MTKDEYIDFRHTLKYSGITRADLDNGIPYAEAIGEVKALLRGAIVVGHNVKSDLDALELTNPEAHCVYDTATNPRLNSLVKSEQDKPQSKLRVLAQCLLGRSIQCTGTHDPEEDALASLELFITHRDLFEDSPGVPKQGYLPPSNPSSVGVRVTLQDGRTVYIE